MIKKFMILIFAGLLVSTSALALAANNDTNKSNNVASVSLEMQAENIESSKVEYSILHAAGKNETTLPVNGWLLAMALFGFVLLSNRAGI
jgi:outer membrane lipoprotein-sorting protein